MHLRRIPITREQLSCIPLDERQLFVVAGHALNEINVLDKLAYLGTLSHLGRDLQGQANAVQAFVLVRVLAGKVSETWEFLQKAYFRTQISKTYTPLLDEEANGALRELKNYFGRKNTVNKVRNEFAFHYDKKHGSAEIPAHATTNDMSIYLPQNSSRPGHALFYYADFLVNKALTDAIDAMDPDAALTSLVTELRDLVISVNKFLVGLIYQIMILRIGQASLHGTAEDIEINDIPSASEKSLPFFIQFP